MLTLGFESAVETAARLEGICSLAKDYGTFRICLNGEELTPAITLYAPELITREVPLGSGHIRKGENTLTIEAIAPATGFTECFFGLEPARFAPAIRAGQNKDVWKAPLFSVKSGAFTQPRVRHDRRRQPSSVEGRDKRFGADHSLLGYLPETVGNANGNG